MLVRLSSVLLLPLLALSAAAWCQDGTKRICCQKAENGVAYYCGQPGVKSCGKGLTSYCCKKTTGPYPKGYVGEGCNDEGIWNGN